MITLTGVTISASRFRDRAEPWSIHETTLCTEVAVIQGIECFAAHLKLQSLGQTELLYNCEIECLDPSSLRP